MFFDLNRELINNPSLQEYKIKESSCMTIICNVLDYVTSSTEIIAVLKDKNCPSAVIGKARNSAQQSSSVVVKPMSQVTLP